jgi:hypothetical protein
VVNDDDDDGDDDDDDEPSSQYDECVTQCHQDV